MHKTHKNTWLFVSLGAILLFVLTVLAYMKDSPIAYPGHWPLLIISGLAIVILGTALVVSIINLCKHKFYWQGLATILLNVITLPAISYAFLVWIIVTAA